MEVWKGNTGMKEETLHSGIFTSKRLATIQTSPIL